MLSNLELTKFRIDDGIEPARSVILLGLYGLFCYLGVVPEASKQERIARQLDAGGVAYIGRWRVRKGEIEQ